MLIFNVNNEANDEVDQIQEQPTENTGTNAVEQEKVNKIVAKTKHKYQEKLNEAEKTNKSLQERLEILEKKSLVQELEIAAKKEASKQKVKNHLKKSLETKFNPNLVKQAEAFIRSELNDESTTTDIDSVINDLLTKIPSLKKQGVDNSTLNKLDVKANQEKGTQDNTKKPNSTKSVYIHKQGFWEISQEQFDKMPLFQKKDYTLKK